MRRWLLLVAALCCVLAGCGGTGGASSLNDVTVSGTSGEAPRVETGTDFHVDRTTSEVLRRGHGAEVSEGDTVTLNYVGVNGRTGKPFDSSYESGTPLTTSLDPESLIPGFVSSLVGKRVGSRTLLAVAPEDGYGDQGNPEAGIEGDDTLVYVVDLISRAPSRATGTRQALPRDMPRLRFDQDGHPARFQATKRTERHVSDLRVAVAIEGHGAKVEPKENVTVQYLAQIYPDGEIFDKSWGRAPESFQIGRNGLVPCWNDGLVGQRVGSRVILVCPPTSAQDEHGGEQAGVQGTDTLIFAVDILAAHEPSPDTRP